MHCCIGTIFEAVTITGKKGCASSFSVRKQSSGVWRGVLHLHSIVAIFVAGSKSNKCDINIGMENENRGTKFRFPCCGKRQRVLTLTIEHTVLAYEERGGERKQELESVAALTTH